MASLPPDTRLDAVLLQVADLARARAWYEGVLGLRLLSEDGDGAVLAAHDDDTPVVALRERPGAMPAQGRGRLGLYHHAILLPDRAALGRLLRHLAQTGERPGAADHLVSEALYLSDPDGLGVEVYADRPRSAWRRDDAGELVMATLPLDASGLLAAAGDGPWTGMPAGTRAGHVHLRVGDLSAADAFYHAALGLEPTVSGYAGALFLSAGGYHHHLGLNTWAGPGATPPPPDEAQLLEWRVRIPDEAEAAAAAARMEDAGYAVQAREGSWTVADRWGIRLRVVTGVG